MISKRSATLKTGVMILLNVTCLNSAVKWTCVLEYLHRNSISGALICNTASWGIFSSCCVLGVSCGHGSVDACRPGFVFLTADWLLCWYVVSSWSLMQRRRLFAGSAAVRRRWCRTGVSRTCVERHIGLHIIITLFLFLFFF